MDKTVSLMMIGTTLVIVALMVITVGSNGLSEFDTSSEGVEDQGCQYQRSNALDPNNNVDNEDISSECRTAEWEQEQERIGVMESLNGIN